MALPALPPLPRERRTNFRWDINSPFEVLIVKDAVSNDYFRSRRNPGDTQIERAEVILRPRLKCLRSIRNRGVLCSGKWASVLFVMRYWRGATPMSIVHLVPFIFFTCSVCFNRFLSLIYLIYPVHLHRVFLLCDALCFGSRCVDFIFFPPRM